MPPPPFSPGKAGPARQPWRANRQAFSRQARCSISTAARPGNAPSANTATRMAGQRFMSGQSRNGAGRPGQFEDVQAGVGAVDDVDVAALVGLDIVGLDRELAALLFVDLDAALVGRRRDRRDEVAGF